MARPQKKIRTSDHEITRIRDQLLKTGSVLVVIRNGKKVAAKLSGVTYGPGHEPPADAVKVPIYTPVSKGGKPARGRPPAGTIAMAAAIALITRYSRTIVERSLRRAPRAGTRRDPTAPCPTCGRSAETAHQPPPMPAYIGTVGRDLDAVGLISAPKPNKAPIDPSKAIVDALAEALEAATAMSALPPSAASLADQLLLVLRK